MGVRPTEISSAAPLPSSLACLPSSAPPAPPSGLRLATWNEPAERVWALARELFLAWDRTVTPAVLEERLGDLRSLLDIRCGFATIRAFAEAAGIPRGDDYRRFGTAPVGFDPDAPVRPDLDVEVIALGWRFFERLGLRDVRLLVNSLGEHADRTRYSEAVRSHLESRRGDLSEKALETLARNPLRVLDSKRPEDRAVVADAPRVADHLSDESAAHFARVLAGLDALGIPYTVEDRLVRGLDYYRRTTFEYVADSLDSAQNAIGGGGRYDRLAEDLGGPPTDGIGFALGVDRTLLACDAEGVFPAPARGLDAFVVDLVGGDAARDLTHALRAAGLSADRRFGAGSMKAQMKAADRSGARFALLVGSDELDAGEVTVRDLRGDADQRRVPRDHLIDDLRTHL